MPNLDSLMASDREKWLKDIVAKLSEDESDAEEIEDLVKDYSI